MNLIQRNKWKWALRSSKHKVTQELNFKDSWMLVTKQSINGILWNKESQIVLIACLSVHLMIQRHKMILSFPKTQSYDLSLISGRKKLHDLIRPKVIKPITFTLCHSYPYFLQIYSVQSVFVANDKWNMEADWLKDMEGYGWKGEEKFQSQWHGD